MISVKTQIDFCLIQTFLCFPGLPSEILNNVELHVPDGSEQEPSPQESCDLTSGATGEGSLVKEEEKATGVVKLEIHKSYWRAVGACLAPSVLVALFLMQGRVCL